MKNTQKGSAVTIILIILAVIIIGSVWYMKKGNDVAPTPITGTGEETPVPQGSKPVVNGNNNNSTPAPAPTVDGGNQNIKAAFGEFKTYAKSVADRGQLNTLCAGGFINVDNSVLEAISDKIITNRVIDAEKMQRATTQDEAGINCVSTEKQWVLFSALNVPKGAAATSDYYCIDSSGAMGKYGVDDKAVACKK